MMAGLSLPTSRGVFWVNLIWLKGLYGLSDLAAGEGRSIPASRAPGPCGLSHVARENRVGQISSISQKPILIKPW